MSPENRRVFLATALSALIMFAFMAWNAKNAPPKPPEGAAKPPAAATQDKAAAPAPTQPAQPTPEVRAVPAAPEETVTLESPEARITFTSHGGALKSYELKGRKFQKTENGKDVQVDLVRSGEGEPYPGSLIPSPELGGTGSYATDPAARASMRIVARDARSVTFEGLVGAAQVRKRFSLSDKPYEIGLEIHATADRRGELAMVYSGYIPPTAPQPGMCGGLLTSGEVYETMTPLCRHGTKTDRYDAKQDKELLQGKAAWIGLDQHYFVSAVLPTPDVGECAFFKGAKAGATGAALRLPLDKQLDVSFRIYEGPKQVDVLRGIGRDLETAVDYGPVTNLFAFFARILLWVMRTVEQFVRNWGLAIIILTFIVKALLYPLTAKSMQSMNEMRKLQPEIEKLKVKFGADKEKMNLAVMQLYQQHKVNPLGGCLPMLIQMPIWFALYATLQTSVELYREPFLWLHDLTQYDPYYILPIAMGASSFLMQKISPQPADNTQAKMLLYFMPAFFTFIMLKLPSGLTLYILVNNVLSIAQQQWLMRKSASAPPKAA